MQKSLAGKPLFRYTLAMEKELTLGAMVRIGHLFLVVEDIDGDTFFGSDADGDEREYLVSQIESIVG